MSLHVMAHFKAVQAVILNVHLIVKKLHYYPSSSITHKNLLKFNNAVLERILKQCNTYFIMNFLFLFVLSRSTQKEITCILCFILHRSILNERIITFCADSRHTFYISVLPQDRF